MNWGKWIFVSFVGFALFIGTLVTVCVREDISLVTPDYYKQELVYQQHMERKQNADALPERPKIGVDQNKISVTFSDFSKVTGGELKLFRPSDARLDQTFNIQPSTATTQTFDINLPQRGLYKASVSWAMNGKEYFTEETLYLN
jgi:hypothetical protein